MHDVKFEKRVDDRAMQRTIASRSTLHKYDTNPQNSIATAATDDDLSARNALDKPGSRSKVDVSFTSLDSSTAEPRDHARDRHIRDVIEAQRVVFSAPRSHSGSSSGSVHTANEESQPESPTKPMHETLRPPDLQRIALDGPTSPRIAPHVVRRVRFAEPLRRVTTDPVGVASWSQLEEPFDEARSRCRSDRDHERRGSLMSAAAAVRSVWRSPRVETWGSAFRPAVLYLNNGTTAGLRATQLPGASGASGTVRRGTSFTIRVVGAHIAARRAPTIGAMSRVLFSEATSRGWRGNTERGGGVHGTRGDGAGYAAVPLSESLVLRCDGSTRVVSVRVVLGETRKDNTRSGSADVLDSTLGRGARVVDADLAGEVADASGSVRNGAQPLRYGYYFLLGAPCDARLYASALIPEHVRLVALTHRRYGRQKKEVDTVSRSISYVVVRVSEV